jgi:cytoskeletal protein CcmA (bactofilin family)
MPEIELNKPGASTNGKAEEPALSVLAKGDALQGHMTIKGDGHLLGKFRGEVDCDGELIIGPEADVAANIRTDRITIHGFVRGNITAIARLKIAPTGRLEGDARVGSLVVQEGGVHHGVIRVHPEGVPDEEEPMVESSEELSPAASAAPLRAPGTSLVERVNKLWGEFF